MVVLAAVIAFAMRIADLEAESLLVGSLVAAIAAGLAQWTLP